MIDFFLLTAAVCLLTVTPFLIQLLRSYARYVDFHEEYYRTQERRMQENDARLMEKEVRGFE